MWKDEQDHRQGEHHAEQPEVDLRLGEQAADRRTRGRLDLSGNGCRVGHVRHDGPPGLVLDTTCAPGRTRGRRVMASSAVGNRYLHAAGADAASTPAHSASLVTWPPSMANCRFSAVSGVGWRMNELTLLPPGVSNAWAVRPATGATAGSMRPSWQRQAGHVAARAQGQGGCPGGLAELVGVLPDVDELETLRDVVQVGGIAVLTADGRVRIVVLAGEGSRDADRRTVVLGQHRVDRRAVGDGLVDDRFHIGLSGLGRPGLRVGPVVLRPLSGTRCGPVEDRDLAGIDLGLETGLVPARGQEGRGIRVTRVALDQDVVARGNLGQDGLGLEPADADVVERDVQDARDPRSGGHTR